MMNARLLIPTFLVMALFLSGCTTGLIYTHKVRPLDINHTRTQAVQESQRGDIKHIQYIVSVTWDSNAIGDIARKNGIKMIHYADLETIRVLSFWRQFIVHVYGE